MHFDNLNDIKKAGFVGFKTMEELFLNNSQLPPVKGVYLILNLDKSPISFLSIGTGGHFKGKNPNVPLPELKNNWVKETIVVYIGKAGSDNSKATLKSRLKQYFGFGQGKNIGHWGGRLIWQLTTSHKLVVCWKPLPNKDPRTVEAKLIGDFVNHYKARLFANLSD